ncbi:MAG: hypothetical protein CMI14_06420 [Oleispira sp.]|nr:hypothetical protein [Oleispira sp.]
MMNKQFYLALWRWHFFAGLYAVPFVLMLSVTGLVMLAHPWTDAWQFGDQLTHVEAPTINSASTAERISSDEQLATVAKAYPDLVPAQFVPPIGDTQSSIFKMRGENSTTLLVFVNPYSGEILGHFNSADRWYSIADDIHGTLMIGAVGDALIELSAGLMIFLLVSGLYLHWPRNSSAVKDMLFPVFLRQLFSADFLVPKKLRILFGSQKSPRSLWKDFHASLGFYLTIFILFFAITGMAWTGIWGQKLVQPFSSFPVEKRASFWKSDIDHSQLNHGQLNDGELNEIPWNLEQVPLPQSTIDDLDSLSLDAIIEQGLMLGFQLNDENRFRVALPLTPEGVYTLMSITSSRDIVNPMQDRTLHIDQYSAEILADIGWENYNLGAKAMALGIPLHKGTLGVWNLVLAILVCLLFVLLAVSGVILWWRRKPSGSFAAPKSGALDKISGSAKAIIFISVLLGLCFPVMGVAMIIFYLFELSIRLITK